MRIVVALWECVDRVGGQSDRVITAIVDRRRERARGRELIAIKSNSAHTQMQIWHLAAAGRRMGASGATPSSSL